MFHEIDGSLLPVGWKMLGLLVGKGPLQQANQFIKKARRTFHYGILGTFQGNLNPLSDRSSRRVYACAYVWKVLTDKSIVQLESFLGQIALDISQIQQLWCR